MEQAYCRYCQAIGQHDGTYQNRRATHALESSYPRCDFHWRFVCAVCENARHFNATAFCPRTEKLFCLHCAPEHRVTRQSFWDWSYYYRLRCPWHQEWHSALDFLEHQGQHPWQDRPAWFRERRGMTSAEEITPAWDLQTAPAEDITDDAIRLAWDSVAKWWISRYSPRGDLNREWVIDPVLFEHLGDVKGLRVLDAGCGTGYFSRMLAERGAEVVGVDLSGELLAIAEQEEAQNPLGVTFHRADLADLSLLDDASFHVVISNVVLQDVRRYARATAEIFRVLRPEGRFIFSIIHPAFDSPPGRWVREPEDSERVEEWRYFAMDDYFQRSAAFWSPRGKPPAIGFHRPLRDYFEALYDAGFVVRRLEEPLPSEEALENHYRSMADLQRVPNFLVVEALKPAAERPHRG